MATKTKEPKAKTTKEPKAPKTKATGKQEVPASTPEELEYRQKVEQINQLLQSPMDATTALNFMIKAVQTAYTSEAFNDVDRAILSKCFSVFKEKIDAGEDFTIKVK